MTGCHLYPAHLRIYQRLKESFQGHAGMFGLHCRQLHSWPKGGGGQALLMSFHQATKRANAINATGFAKTSGTWATWHSQSCTKVFIPSRRVYLSHIVSVYWRFFHNPEQHNLAMSALFGPTLYTTFCTQFRCPQRLLQFWQRGHRDRVVPMGQANCSCGSCSVGAQVQNGSNFKRNVLS